MHLKVSDETCRKLLTAIAEDSIIKQAATALGVKNSNALFIKRTLKDEDRVIKKQMRLRTKKGETKEEAMARRQGQLQTHPTSPEELMAKRNI
jgi:hypothetical protein